MREGCLEEDLFTGGDEVVRLGFVLDVVEAGSERV